MEKLGNFLRANLPDLQRRVEDKLEVKLGTIDVKPMLELASEVRIPLTSIGIRKVIKLPYLLALPSCGILEEAAAAAAGESTVYYTRSRSKLSEVETEYDMNSIGAHELSHIGHLRLLNGDWLRYLTCPQYVSEGFPEFVAREIMKDMGLDSAEKVYETLFKQFEDELKRRNLSGIKGAKELALSFK